MTQIQSNPEVVQHLLSRFTFAKFTDLQEAQAVLTRCVLSSMQAPAAYALPLDQRLPDEFGPDGAFSTVHPYNVATALVSISLAGQRLGGDTIALDPGLQLWDKEWSTFNKLAFQPVQIEVAKPATPPPAPATPPPAPTTPPPAPTVGGPNPQTVMDLVNAAMAEGANEPVVDPAVKPAEEPGLAGKPPKPPSPGKPKAPPAPPVAPSATPATPTVATKPPGPPAPSAPLARNPGGSIPEGDHSMPDPDVTLQRTGQSGRPQASPFQRKIEARTKLAEPPFWWGFLVHSAERVLTQSPSQALDPSSQGSGPVQAYSLLAHLLHDKVLAGVDPYLTVAALRVYLKEVIANIDGLNDAAAINQLTTALLGDDTGEAAE